MHFILPQLPKRHTERDNSECLLWTYTGFQNPFQSHLYAILCISPLCINHPVYQPEGNPINKLHLRFWFYYQGYIAYLFNLTQFLTFWQKKKEIGI